jgi:hypothetical protein
MAYSTEPLRARICLNLLAADALEAAVVQNALNGLAVGGRAVVDGVDHRERGLALAQVAGHGLAQNLFGGRQVEHVIDNLEGQADSPAIGGQARLLASEAPASTAPRRIETEKRQAVLR